MLLLPRSVLRRQPGDAGEVTRSQWAEWAGTGSAPEPALSTSSVGEAQPDASPTPLTSPPLAILVATSPGSWSASEGPRQKRSCRGPFLPTLPLPSHHLPLCRVESAECYLPTLRRSDHSVHDASCLIETCLPRVPVIFYQTYCWCIWSPVKQCLYFRFLCLVPNST